MLSIADLSVSEREEIVWKRLEVAVSTMNPETHRYPSDEECNRIEKKLREEFLLDSDGVKTHIDSSPELPHTD